MKILVVGVGSIGTRHLRNLVEFGHEVYAVDINIENLKKVSVITKGIFISIDEAVKVKPEIAFICTYSNDHIEPAIKCAEAGCHLFIVEMIIKFSSDAVCIIHMDYLQHGYSRRCKVVCGEGTIVWDFIHGDIGIITTSLRNGNGRV